MTQARLGVGVVGLGFVGRAHIDALRRIPGLRVVAAAGSDASSIRAGAAALDIPNAYGDYHDLIADPDVDVVHNCTPNYLHTVINRACVEAGKACFAEKPLTTTSAEASQLVALARQRHVPVAVNFNHRGFPQVQRARQLVADGQLGDVYTVHGGYLQDWLLFDSDWNWRLDPDLGGASRAVADIGSHWMDLVQHVTGARISEVMADLSTHVPERYQPSGKIETFGNASNHNGRRVKMDTEDFASVLLRFDNGARGSFNVSQVSAGRKNRLTFEIDCAQAAVAWDSEDGERLWVGSRTEPARVGLRDPLLQGRGSMPLPAGHAEGWNDALRTTIGAFYDALRGGQQQPWVAGWEDGLHETLLTESILASGREGTWVRVPRVVSV